MSKFTNVTSVTLSGIALIVALFAYDRAGDPTQAIESFTAEQPPAAIATPQGRRLISPTR